MSNAAIFFHSDAFDASGPKLMGRQSAGESFLRGFLRHADVDRFYFWNWGAEPLETCQAIVERIQPTDKPVTWLARSQFSGISEPGALFVSSPANTQESWNRRLLGPNRYSLCGLTHTTASQGVMDTLNQMLIAPVEPWDATICTSRAVTESIRAHLDLVYEHLAERLGATKRPEVRLETIPLGINTEDFHRSEPDRARLRRELGIADDALVVLYVGRFSMNAKMNPVPMAMALERAARRTKRHIHWVQVGWAHNDHMHTSFTANAHRHCPSVTCHVLDGRRPDVRFACWSMGDLFLSLSDNIQETFGLTPVEAMAAGLPQVISDWDGYRDTVRHEIDGFRVPTLSPRPGLGADIAVGFGNGWQNYDRYVGEVAQFTAVDLDAAADALLALFENDDLRARMGAAAKERAFSVFDWRTVIRQYQALWTELAAIRTAAPVKPAGPVNPWRPDPFFLFAGYPTRTLAADAVLSLSPGASPAALRQLLDDPTVLYVAPILPREGELVQVLAHLETRGPTPVAGVLEGFAPGRRGAIERGLLWLAKFGLATVSPMPTVRPG